MGTTMFRLEFHQRRRWFKRQNDVATWGYRSSPFNEFWYDTKLEVLRRYHGDTIEHTRNVGIYKWIWWFSLQKWWLHQQKMVVYLGYDMMQEIFPIILIIPLVKLFDINLLYYIYIHLNVAWMVWQFNFNGSIKWIIVEI